MQVCRGCPKNPPMKTPVLIPARNEAASLGTLLDALPAGSVDPIVIANGCEDDTADVASGYGASVMDLAEPGKLPAVQFALRSLGSRAIGAPVIMTDADSVPVLPRQWSMQLPTHAERQARSSPVQTAIVAGPVIAHQGTSRYSNVLRSARRFVRQAQFQFDKDARGVWCGANIAIRLGSADELEAVLSMPHYWPGEDIALADMLRQRGATASQSLSPRQAVAQSARYSSPILEYRWSVPKAIRHRVNVAAYEQRGAPGSFPYEGMLKAPSRHLPTGDLVRTR